MAPSQRFQFQFVDDLDQAAAAAGAVELPAGIKTKRQLMRALIRALPLPDYFGGNWDALDECLRDRLLDDTRPPLCLLHRDLPLRQSPRACRDYLSLLDDTLAWSQETTGCDFTVVFPMAEASTIEQLVRSYEDS